MKEQENTRKRCPVADRCGSCGYSGVSYKKQLEEKQQYMEELLGEFCQVKPILGMEQPYYYRNKVHHVFGQTKNGIISGSYEADSHYIVNIDHCLLEDRLAQDIMKTLRTLIKSFKISIYHEDSGRGLFRHALIRRGFSSQEVMVVLVMTSPILPGKNNFVKALKAAHPEITTIVLNINDKDTSMVLGSRNITLYGPGFIKDRLLDCTFRISPASFYQVNPVQTEVLYRTVLEYAALSGKETVVDAYCGVGTIGLFLAGRAKQIIGAELNADAVKDAILNAKENHITNARFYQEDAGVFLRRMAEQQEKADVIVMDPPRSGSTETFLSAVSRILPKRLVYVSCEPETLKRDLVFLKKQGWNVHKIQPVDMFPMTKGIEAVVQLSPKF